MKIKTKRYYIYYLLRILAFFVYILPVRFALASGFFLGKLGFYLLHGERVKTIRMNSPVVFTKPPVVLMKTAGCPQVMVKNGLTIITVRMLKPCIVLL